MLVLLILCGLLEGNGHVVDRRREYFDEIEQRRFLLFLLREDIEQSCFDLHPMSKATRFCNDVG